MAGVANALGIGDGDRVVSVRMWNLEHNFWYYFHCSKLKSMDANRYATKKTIAQGMLDIALLSANSAQLKYVLQVGEKHEFYTLMLTLISISIILQVIIQCSLTYVHY